MFVEELTKIKESEDQAISLQKKAKSDAKKAVEEARQEADRLVSAAEVAAKETYARLIAEGQAQSEQEYKAYIDKAKDDCKALIDKALENEGDAIKLIVERIVGTSVNS